MTTPGVIEEIDKHPIAMLIIAIYAHTAPVIFLSNVRTVLAGNYGIALAKHLCPIICAIFYANVNFLRIRCKH